MTEYSRLLKLYRVSNYREQEQVLILILIHIDLEKYLKLAIKSPKLLLLDGECILINKANRVVYEKEKKDFNKLNK